MRNAKRGRQRMKQAGFYNCDCLEAMREYPDKYFDLAIVDPPYGSGGVEEWEKTGRTGGGYFKKYGKKIIDWDIAPGKEYFEELFRISKYQIIWGGNYFNEYLPSNRNFIIWRKLTISESFTMAMAEYAWTSLKGNAKVFECAPQGTKTEPRFHPTQKPVALYEWLLSQYANKGYKILDTHAGSGSSLIACHRMGFEITAFEIDKEYYQKAKARLEEEKAQIKFNL